MVSRNNTSNARREQIGSDVCLPLRETEKKPPCYDQALRLSRWRGSPIFTFAHKGIIIWPVVHRLMICRGVDQNGLEAQSVWPY